MFIKITFFFLLVLIPFFGHANTTYDNLYNELKKHVKEFRSLDKNLAFSRFELIYDKVLENEFYDLLVYTSIQLAWCSEYFNEIDKLLFYLDKAEKYSANNIGSYNYFKEIYFTKGLLYIQLRDYNKSIETFNHFIKNLNIKNLNDSLYVHSAFSYVGDSYFNLDNKFQAQLSYENCQKYLYPHNTEAGNTFTYEFYNAVNYNKMGNTLASSGNYIDAKNYFNKALQFIKEKENIYNNLFGSIQLSLSKFHYNYREYNSALKCLDKANKFLESLNPIKIRINLLYGNIYREQNELKIANRYYEKSNQLIDSLVKYKHARRAEINYNQALLYKNKSFLLALQFSQKSLINLVSDFNNEDVTSLPKLENIIDESNLLEALKIKGNIWFAMYEQDKDQQALQHSIACFNLAFDLIDKMRNNFQSADYKSYIADKATSIYGNAIEVAYTALQNGVDQEKYTNLIYQYLERNKSRLLLQSLASTASRQFAGVPDSILDQERDYLRKIAYLKDQVTSLEVKGASEQLTTLRQELFDNQYNYDRLVSQLQTTYPDYFQLKYNTQIVSLAEVQSGLQDGETIVNYFAGDSSIYVLGIGQQSVTIRKIGQPVEVVQQQVQQMIAMLTSSNSDMAGFTSAAWQLHEHLLSPVLQAISGDISKIKIIPDGFIAYLPFEVLLTSPASAERASQLPYAIRKYQISYAYSYTTSHYQQLRSGKKNLYSYAGFAPDANAWDLSEHPFYQKDANHLVELAAIEDEVKEASGIFKGLSFLQQEASESNFKKMAPQSKILHISSHALLHDQYPQYSGIVLANTNNTGFKTLFAGVGATQPNTVEDGFLHIHELYNMELNADLAILSACETGMGSYSRGEGIMSLGRGFAYAGCPSVLMSLWKANDKATKELMGRFTRYIKSGMDKDAALRQAKLDYLEESDRITSHPYFWSAFVLMGNEEAVDFSDTRSNRAVWIWIVIFLILSTGTLFYLKRARMLS